MLLRPRILAIMTLAALPAGCAVSAAPASVQWMLTGEGMEETDFRVLNATKSPDNPGELLKPVSRGNKSSLLLDASASLDPPAMRRSASAKLDSGAILALSRISDGFTLGLAQPLLDSTRRDQAQAAKKLPVAPLTAKEKDLFELGRTTYATCALCHQPDGLGREDVALPLAGSRWALTSTYHVPARIVMNGKEGTPGYPVAIGHLNMLSDEQIAGVLTYVRRSWGNEAPAISPADIAHVRTSVRRRGRGWTNDELEAVAERLK